jgi:hypothetical protein
VVAVAGRRVEDRQGDSIRAAETVLRERLDETPLA